MSETTAGKTVPEALRMNKRKSAKDEKLTQSRIKAVVLNHGACKAAGIYLGGKMKTCVGCKYAKWDRTKTGRLSPTGGGRCAYDYVIPQLPQSMYWGSSYPVPSGGYISRRDELKNHCVYYQG